MRRKAIPWSRNSRAGVLRWAASQETKRRTLIHLASVPIVVIVVLLLLPLFLLFATARVLYGTALQVVIWLCWCRRGINVLLVYSESPNWYEYIEDYMIPKLPPSTVRLNWSERREWRYFSLPVMAFRFLGGSREFNPMVVVFRPFRWAQTYRFWKPFQDFKHGKTEALAAMEAALLEHLSRAGLGTAADDKPKQLDL